MKKLRTDLIKSAVVVRLCSVFFFLVLVGKASREVLARLTNFEGLSGRLRRRDA